MATVATESIVLDHHLPAEEFVDAEAEEATKLVQRITTNKDLGLEGFDISELVSSVVNRQHILPTSLNYRVGSEKIAPTEETQGRSKVEIIAVEESEEEEEEEEVVELEFERAAEKVHTHTPYCPKCNSQITKVILRRKVPKKKNKKKIEAPPSADDDDDEPVDLLGCLSCFSIFTPSGNKLRPFRNFWAGKRKPDAAKPEEPSCEAAAAEEEIIASPPPPEKHAVGEVDDVIIAVGGDEAEAAVESSSSSSLRKLDILRCIVYGGLAESIASLSVVSSAAASDVSTLKIVAIGLATVISSVGIFAQNLVELKNEQYGPNSAANRYKQLLGHSKDNFLVHSTLSVLSFTAFGLVPPVVYGFSFRESDNKPYKIVAVAAAACACVCGLAVARAYLERCRRFREYFKTVAYYVALAVAGSGVGYAAGELVRVLLERLGLFGPDPSGNFPPAHVASSAEVGPWMSSFR